ncbi:T-cell-specific guanine nucleotide triphosphate-binding protein 1-like [Dendronephthya gigantea]|uniref:T-cell-specific guanine nucleotide triphosphate-binding protein 1-like n=1 Tax=Dendronephthya gigantea TaxID=151771 RepID=UPI00106B5306|nr:T-cell-specific guanine nucleotide triphosphate-binding protein 1-like [Dendronephthya gigantea]
MGSVESKTKGYEKIDDGSGHVKPRHNERGVIEAQELIKEKSTNWRNVEIRIGVIGTSGVGKSSFINAFRGLNDDDERAAKTGIVGTTSEPTFYPYTENPKIILVDIPAFDPSTCPEILHKCDTFFILTATRFRIEEHQIAQKIKSMGKSFLFVRTKMDLDEENETRKKNRKIEDVVKNILDDLLDNLRDLDIGKDEIFLVSNFERHKWDFDRLVKSILDKLPTHQKEASIRPVMIETKDYVRRKIDMWLGQLWWVWLYLILVFFPLDIVTLGLLSHLISRYQITKKTEHYRSQLGLPEEGSKQFTKMKAEFQDRMRVFFPKENSFCAKYCERILHPKKIIFAANYTCAYLANVLKGMESLSMDLLDQAAAETEQAIDKKSEME